MSCALRYCPAAGRNTKDMVVISTAHPPGTLAIDEATPCHAVIPRQFSIWPFGTGNLRLVLLIDPSRMDADLLPALIRAIQHTYFRVESGSQTNAVREALLAAHYVLRHHNHDALPQAQVTAAAAVAIRRG